MKVAHKGVVKGGVLSVIVDGFGAPLGAGHGPGAGVGCGSDKRGGVRGGGLGWVRMVGLWDGDGEEIRVWTFQIVIKCI